MDVDPGTFPFNHFIIRKLIIYLDVHVPSAPVRLLPYSSVPGMLTSSPLFFKAVSIIAKQFQSPNSSTTTSASPAASAKGKKKDKTGAFNIFLFCLLT